MMKRLLLLLFLCSVPLWATVPSVPFTVSYTCTGGYGPYAFTFPISDPTALAVTMNSVLLSPAYYTTIAVNNNYSNGGSVTLDSTHPCTTGWTITLTRSTPLTQTLRFYDNMPIPMTTFERGLDKLTEITQELEALAGTGSTSIQMQNNGIDYLAAATGAIIFNFVNATVTGTQGNYTITATGGGGGGGSPAGTTNDVQLNGSPTTFSSDTGVFYHNPSTHTTYTNTVNASNEVDVAGASNGVLSLRHTTGGTPDAVFDQSVSSTFVTGAGGYKIYWPDSPMVGLLNLTSLTPDSNGYLPTEWTTTISLGSDNVQAGSVTLANGSAAAHSTIESAATTSNTIKLPATVIANGHIVVCSTTSTTCTLADGGLPAGGSVTGSGSTNRMTKFTGATAIGDSSFQNATANILDSPTATQSLTYQGGSDGAAGTSTLGSAIVRGADAASGGAGSVAGGVLLRGGNSAANNATAHAGSIEIEPGRDTGASGQQGILNFANEYRPAGTSTQWFLQCFDTAAAVQNCGATPSVIAGVADVVTANNVQVHVLGSQTPVAASAAVTLGHTVCAGSTAGKVTDSGGTGACALGAGFTVGTVIDVAGTYVLPDGDTWTATTTLPIIRLDRTQAVGNAASASNVAFGGITTGSNTAATMTCGAGCSITTTSTGVNNANQVNGATVPASKKILGSNSSAQLIDASAAYTTRSCEVVWAGTGTASALQSGDDAVADNSCFNKIGVTETITAVYCKSDNGTNTTTVNPTFGATGTGTTICSGALTCGSSNAYSSSCTVSNGALTDGTGIDPVMGGSLTGTNIHMLVVYTLP